MTDEILVKTAENELSLQEMAEALPDTSTIMTRVGESWWRLYYAAQGGNWALADYYLRRVRKLDNTLSVLRPKHRERLDRFQATVLPEVTASIEAGDFDRFQRAFDEATATANRLHGESGYPYIKWILPTEVPVGLELGPVEVTPQEQPA